MDGRCRREVTELHGFFEGWFNGTLAATEESFNRFSSVMAPGFEIIFPNSRAMGRDELLAHVRGAHGLYAPGGKRIRVENCICRAIAPTMRLVTYEEWIDGPEGSNGRLSSAVMRLKEGTPNGVEWLHVHEARLDQPRSR